MVFKPCPEASEEEFAARRARTRFGLAGKGAGWPATIYFVEAPRARLIKIGQTQHLRSRFSGLRAASPVNVRLLAYLEGFDADERALHLRFANWRTHGEWFRPNPHLMAMIDTLARENPLPAWAGEPAKPRAFG